MTYEFLTMYWKFRARLYLESWNRLRQCAKLGLLVTYAG